VIRALISSTLLLAVAACSRSGPVDKQALKPAGLPSINARAPSAAGEPHGRTAPANAAPAPAATIKIPAALQGRWGLAPADCTSALGDAKGLLVINADELRFYESRAMPAGDVTADATSVSGNFAFTGEGQRWTRYEALKVDKRTLVRTEMNPTASFTYAKCS
jgi:hypothetical protein